MVNDAVVIIVVRGTGFVIGVDVIAIGIAIDIKNMYCISQSRFQKIWSLP